MNLHRTPTCPGTFRAEGKRYYRCDACRGTAYRCPEMELAVQMDHLLRSLTAEGARLASRADNTP